MNIDKFTEPSNSEYLYPSEGCYVNYGYYRIDGESNSSAYGRYFRPGAMEGDDYGLYYDISTSRYENYR